MLCLRYFNTNLSIDFLLIDKWSKFVLDKVDTNDLIIENNPGRTQILWSA